MRVAGVSLEHSFLRISIVDKKIGVIKPVTSEDIRLPSSEQEKAPAIKEIFQRLKERYKADSVAIGLGIENFSHHIIDMPSLSEADMRNALLYELEKYLPLPVEEYLYDFSAVERGQSKTKTLILSIRKEKMNGLLNVIKDSGLHLNAIRCSFIEAVNEFIAISKIKEAIFVYATEDTYNIVALKDQMPVSLKTVSKGKDVAYELERFNESFKSDIYISGAVEPGLLDKINARTVPLSLANAVALSALRRQRLGLNFKSREFLPARKEYYNYAIGVMTALAVVLFFFNSIFSYYKDYAALSNIEKKIEQFKDKSSGFVETRKKVETIYEKKKFLYDFQAKRHLNIRVLTELSRVMPKDTWLSSMTIDEKGKVTVEGISRRAVNIIEPLSKSSLFKKVEFVSPIVSQNGQEKFSIRMEISS